MVDNAFVPAYRSQSHWDYMLGREMPGWEINPSPLYRLPFAVVFNYALTASVLGAARGFLEAWIEAKRNRKLGLGGNANDDPFIQRHLAEADFTIDAGMLKMRRDADELMAAGRAKVNLSLQRRAAIRYNACRSAQMAARTIDDLFESSTGKAIFLDHPLQRRYQDIKAMLGHAYLNADSPARMLGALALGQRVVSAML